MNDLFHLVERNSYPGRGIVLGKTADGKALIAYFIMGRSENSQNRVFSGKDGGIITEAFDIARMADPSLIIYAPVRVFDRETTIVTNGDQTDSIFEALAAGKTFEDALRTRTYEPDPPNFTPRVSGLLKAANGDMRYQLSILKAGTNASALRFFYDYPEPQAGEGHFIHTYESDGNPLPSFHGEPTAVALGGDEPGTFAQALWSALNKQNRVSLFVRSIHLTNGETQTKIINKHG